MQFSKQTHARGAWLCLLLLLALLMTPINGFACIWGVSPPECYETPIDSGPEQPRSPDINCATHPAWCK